MPGCLAYQNNHSRFQEPRLEPTTIITICSVIFPAGFVQGLTGFGGALVAIPFLSFVVRLEHIVPKTLPR
jgi:uncharacterized membrane protein YfcA